jgi:hypothetical protein
MWSYSLSQVQTAQRRGFPRVGDILTTSLDNNRIEEPYTKHEAVFERTVLAFACLWQCFWPKFRSSWDAPVWTGMSRCRDRSLQLRRHQPNLYLSR